MQRRKMWSLECLISPVAQSKKKKQKRVAQSEGKNYLSFYSTLGSMKIHRFIRLKWRVLATTLTSSSSLSPLGLWERERVCMYMYIFVCVWVKKVKSEQKKTRREAKAISYLASCICFRLQINEINILLFFYLFIYFLKFELDGNSFLL